MLIKLKSSKEIATLYNIGRKTFFFPLKCVYSYKIVQEETSSKYLTFGVSVSKRNLSRAVDRNLVKRRMREAVRKYYQAYPNITNDTVVMLSYVHNEILEYKLIEKSTFKLLKSLISKH